MEKYYTQEECIAALKAATNTINQRAASSSAYKRGYNDCMAFLAEYDKELRKVSKVEDFLDFEWKTTKEFMVKLARKEASLASMAQYCGYETVSNKRPQVGDIGFFKGATVTDGNFWYSPKEDNSGVAKMKQQMFLERHFLIIARPIRS